jgi:transposase-like protein
MVAILCPLCHEPEAVIKHGANRNGTARLRCKDCQKTFTPEPRPRKLSPQKEEQIVHALAERISQYGIARTFGVSRVTVHNIQKKRTAHRREGAVGPHRPGRAGSRRRPRSRRGLHRVLSRLVAVARGLPAGQASPRGHVRGPERRVAGSRLERCAPGVARAGGLYGPPGSVPPFLPGQPAHGVRQRQRANERRGGAEHEMASAPQRSGTQELRGLGGHRHRSVRAFLDSRGPA